MGLLGIQSILHGYNVGEPVLDHVPMQWTGSLLVDLYMDPCGCPLQKTNPGVGLFLDEASDSTRYIYFAFNESIPGTRNTHGAVTTKDSILQSILDHRHANKLMMKMLCFTEDNMIEVRA